MASQYEFHLDGVHALDLPLALLRDLVDLIVEGAARAARLAAEGRSTARGSSPAWLASAAEVRLVGFREGSLALDVTARPLTDVAPQIFGPGVNGTAVDLLLEAVEDALGGRRDSERLDGGVLQVLMRTRALFSRGSSRLQIRRPHGAPLELGERTAESFQRLLESTPRPQVERLVGVLDSLTLSTRTCQIVLADGSSLKGYVAPALPLDGLKALMGEDVVIEGTIGFRPSGRPQRIEIDHVAPAAQPDAIWRRVPRGHLTSEQLTLAGTDVGALYGQWPGDESDEELQAALAASS